VNKSVVRFELYIIVSHYSTKYLPILYIGYIEEEESEQMDQIRMIDITVLRCAVVNSPTC
jgi:hypothetical protein